MADNEVGENPERDERKRNLQDAIRQAAAGEVPEAVEFDEPDDLPSDVVTNQDAIPDWAKLPDNFPMPEGWVVFFVRFRAAWTNTPKKGDRVCVLWNLSEPDEKLAARQARGDGLRLIEEMSKRMIRSIDGLKADWGGAPGPANVNQFWSEIGGKCRYMLKSLYLKNHTLSTEESLDFFEHCVTSRSAG
jgi:hypothetical protein